MPSTFAFVLNAREMWVRRMLEQMKTMGPTTVSDGRALSCGFGKKMCIRCYVLAECGQRAGFGDLSPCV